MTFDYHSEGFGIIPNYVDKQYISLIRDYLSVRFNAGHAASDATAPDVTLPNTIGIYCDPLADTILARGVDVVSKFIGEEVLPTYSYSRLYAKGDLLNRHRDRPACEISISLHIARPNNTGISPLIFSHKQDGSDGKYIFLDVGEAAIYNGIDVWHERPAFDQEWYMQMFLHYVRKNGPHADCLLDGRPCLGYNENAKK